METKASDLVSIFERSLKGVAETNFEEVGIVIQVGDGICRAYGLKNALYGEVVEFEGGNRGVILDLGEDVVSIFLLKHKPEVSEPEVVKRTGNVFRIPVGKALLGRVVNSACRPLDSSGDIEADVYWAVERPIPGVTEREPIVQPVETGILVVDALVPIGKGQRELVIGNRNTGKTALLADIVLNQRGKNVICVYVCIAQRESNLARLLKLLSDNGAMEYTTIVNADASSEVLEQYLAPYTAATVAEYFQQELKKDVLIIYDDLTSHAIAYRQMSLLMRRPPGREAYPGDVFYLHSRLLERAGRFSRGGSITALPVVQTQGDDISAYIPTNLISITDGQIFLDTKYFNRGVRPAVNVGLSVSRIGGAAQFVGVRRMAKALRVELAQYYELVGFSQFGTELDPVSQEKLRRGKLALEILKQRQYVTYSTVEEIVLLFLLHENFLDGVKLEDARRIGLKFVSYLRSVYPQLYEGIEESKDISDDSNAILRKAAEEFTKVFSTSAQFT